MVARGFNPDATGTGRSLHVPSTPITLLQRVASTSWNLNNIPESDVGPMMFLGRSTVYDAVPKKNEQLVNTCLLR